MKTQNRQMALLMLLSGVLMSLPWLIPHTGFIILFALVPLLCMERIASLTGVKRFWLWHYSTFVLWNTLTTFWVCNATIGGGIFAILANSLQMSVVFGAFRLSKKRLQGVLPYLFLALMWIAWERFYFSAQISWPWLVLGNAFARSTGLIQWYEYTGVLGGSLWVWASNLAIFGMMSALSEGSFFDWNGKARAAAISAFVLVIFAPAIASRVIWYGLEEKSEGTLDVLITQPNFDPYQKFEHLTQQQQNAVLVDMVDRELDGEELLKPLLIIAPETFTNDIICDSYQTSPTWNRFLSMLNDHPGTSMLFGASSGDRYEGSVPRNPNDYHLKDGTWMQRHNSAIAMEADGSTEIFHKSKLVVGVEMAPYPKLFVPLSEKLGAGIGRCVGQPEVSVLHCAGVPVGSIVCYESIYGEYCTGYVNKGAKALTVITNDAWWGNTPGYKQHLSYSALRAIELRRDIARCGNTGISCLIDQRGAIHDRSPWWEQTTVRGSVNLNSEITYFAEHGDIVGRVCTFAFLLLLLALIVRFITPKR